jgi:hypothetical protein
MAAERRCGRTPGVYGEEAAQDGEYVLAVFAGGVDVAAGIQPVLGGVFAGEAPGYLLLGLVRPDAALADVIQANRRLRVIGAVRRQRAGCG